MAGTDDLVVLGIDAAWTEGQPSGVALIQRQGRSWRCLAVTPSYGSFIEARPGTAVDWEARPSPGRPDMNRIIAAATRLAGRRPDVIAADMPLSTDRITGRRAADTQVSREFGARKCGTHSPSEVRPGPLSEQIRDGSRANGYSLACADTGAGTRPALLEVYPHTALLRLMDAKERVEYKAGKTTTYWKALPLHDRRQRLLETWRQIRSQLGLTIRGLELLPLPQDAGSFAHLKRFEDGLDAVICAWMGMLYLQGDARACGDASCAIWT